MNFRDRAPLAFRSIGISVSLAAIVALAHSGVRRKGAAMADPPRKSASNVAQQGDTPPAGLLSVDETIGLTFYHDVPHSWHLYKRANPEAKEALYRIIAEEELERNHMIAFLLLGHVGDATDARKMQQWLRERSGLLGTWEKSAATGALYGLGIMSRRGVSKASEILDEMTSINYWKESGVKWYSPKLQNPPLTSELELVANVIWAQAIAGRDSPEMRTKIIGGIGDTKVRSYMAHRIDPEHTKEYVDNIESGERKSPTERERDILQTLFQTHSEALSEKGTGAAERPRREAFGKEVTADQVQAMIARGDASALEVLRRWLNEPADGPAARDGRLLIAIIGSGAFQDNSMLKRIEELYARRSLPPLLRNAAGAAISSMAGEGQTNLLRDIVWAEDTSLSTRCEAARALVRLGQDDGREFLLLQYDLYRLEAQTREIQTGFAAQRVLAEMYDEHIMDHLQRRLAEETDERMKRNIVTTGKQMAINGLPLNELLILAADPAWPEADRRYWSIEAIGEKGSLDQIAFLDALPPWVGSEVPQSQFELLKIKSQEAIARIRQRHWKELENQL